METCLKVFRNISEAFSGTFQSEFSANMIQDLTHDLSIPTASDDRRNLQADGRSIASELSSAFDSYKLDAKK
jgi:triosephosphate isomerase